MYRLRCQVCCQRPASRTELGYLFLLERPVSRTEDGWPEGVLTPHPPLCLAHAGVSVERCPPLRKGHVAVRATRPRLYGVRGLVLTPGWTQMLHVLPDDPDDEEAVAYQSPRARWCLATQQVRRLCGVTVIDLEAELAAAGLGR
ncbi:hypothetical protein AB0I22_19615 [Streptomyces sp. NPDC050610]|uniref:hypothetical protein n=1 Tax=Streptomyces sp. NPDC050610 TaxID=3157097 RepID=UPI00341A88D3